MGKRWIAVLVAVALVTGLAVGFGLAIKINPQTADVYLLNLGSVGDWVSGIGALIAVGVTLWLNDQQRKANEPKLEVSQFVEVDCANIDLVSVGDRGALLMSIFLRSKKHNGSMSLSPKGFSGKRLEYGDIQKIRIEADQYLRVCRTICGDEDMPDLADLELVVETSTQTFLFPASQELIGVIEGTLTVGASHF